MGARRRTRSWMMLGAAVVLLWVGLAVALARTGSQPGSTRAGAVSHSSAQGPVNGTAGRAPVAAPAAGFARSAGADIVSPPAGQSTGGGGGSGSTTQEAAAGTPISPVPPGPGPVTVPGADLAGPKVVENASVNLTVKHGALENIVTQLTNLAAAEGGFVTESDTSSGGGQPTANLTLRIPNAQYSAALQDIRSFGKVTSLQSSGQDVTGQYVDLRSQIEALQASQRQYQTIMTKATTVGDILAVQSQLDSIDSQLQQLEGQANVLDNQTTYATISVSARAAPAPGQRPRPRPRPATGLARAWHRATSGFAAGFDGLVVAAGPLAFILALLAALGLLARLGWALVAGRRRHPGGVAPSAS